MPSFFHLLETNSCFFPLLVSKGIYHYWISCRQKSKWKLLGLVKEEAGCHCWALREPEISGWPPTFREGQGCDELNPSRSKCFFFLEIGCSEAKGVKADFKNCFGAGDTGLHGKVNGSW